MPSAEIFLIKRDGTPSGVGETGELVHRGPFVTLGYWNDPQKTSERFRPLPSHHKEFPSGEAAAWSGDEVRMDEDGFLYFVGRLDDRIKTGGFRVSPTEVESSLYATGLVGEAVAFGVPHHTLGQGIVVVATPAKGGRLDRERLLEICGDTLPTYLVPRMIVERSSLARNANGKIDRKALAKEFVDAFQNVDNS